MVQVPVRSGHRILEPWSISSRIHVTLPAQPYRLPGLPVRTHWSQQLFLGAHSVQVPGRPRSSLWSHGMESVPDAHPGIRSSLQEDRTKELNTCFGYQCTHPAV